MKIKLLFLLLICLVSRLSAQMDTEHWFAPMARQTGNTNSEAWLYFSTNETTPFEVKIENNNILLGSVTISKGSPAKFSLNTNNLVTGNLYNSTQPLTLGLHVYSDKKFFANVRFSHSNHAEIITSKGRAGLGTHFFAVYAPFSQDTSPLNYTIGVIAREDNTQVTLGSTQVTLNKAQSYILEGFPNDNSKIGLEITSNKPISLTNGNYNGQYASSSNNAGSDILMDQAVPVERLGMKYILMKGNGELSTGMETAIIVATEDQTELYFNNESSPATVLNKGQYYMMPPGKYIQQTSGIYNAYLSTSRNVYVYQLLSGSGSIAAGGFNYIPPLNCYLPKKIDELGFINENPGVLNPGGHIDTHLTRLNIITQHGAAVKVNGAPIANIYGPSPVTGTSEWDTYSIPSVSGNITVESTKAVTAGIAAGDAAVGYGGYFAGASSLPVVTKSGECFPGVSLEVDENYDNFQWQLKNPISGNFEDIAGATNFKYSPQQPGDYRVVIGTIGCGTIETPSYPVLPCTVTSQQNLLVCGETMINLAFSSSAQSIDFSKLKIRLAPTQGTVTVVNNKIVYKPNVGFTDNTTDTFSYYLESAAAYPDSEIITVNITLKKFSVTDATLNSCSQNGLGTYDLTTAEISTEIGLQYEHFEDQALSVPINTTTITQFSTNLTTVFVKATNKSGCVATAKINLQKYPEPSINIGGFDPLLCDNDLDGTVNLKFSDITPLIVQNSGDFIVTYALKSDPMVPLADVFSFSQDTPIVIKVANKFNCPPVFGEITLKIKQQIALSTVPNQTICDSDLDGQHSINLGDYSVLFTTSANATYYKTSADAKNKNNAVASNQKLTSNATFYYRFENNVDCPAVGELTFNLKQPKKSDSLEDIIICKNSTTTLNAGAGFDSYHWNTGAITSSITVAPGDYFVDLEYNSCIYRQNVKVIPAADPIISEVRVEGNTAKIIVSGGQPPYQFSLDEVKWQTSEIFNNLPRGIGTVYVKDSKACSVINKEFLVLNLLNVITPNGDGYNDVLDYSDLRIKKDVSIQIFDRYGKNVFQSSANNYIWNGYIGGRPAAAGTYWYVLRWTEPDTGQVIDYNGWILVKNQ